ncbi:response regulator [Deltaproteobacteria bacterium TL4]
MTSKADILILDDDFTFLEQIQKTLTHLGYSVSMLTSSEYLFNRLQEEAFDLLLLDVHLEETSGKTLLKNIKIQPSLQALPVIMLTTDPDDSLLKQCFELGAADFLRKPVSEVILQARIENVLEVQHYQEELLQEIRRRQKIEDDLRVSQSRLLLILDSMDEAIVSIDATYKIIFFNQNAEKLSGYAFKEIYGQTLDQLMSFETQDLFNKTGQTVKVTLQKKTREKFETQALIIVSNLEKERTLSLIVEMRTFASGKISKRLPRIPLAWKNKIDTQKQKIRSLEKGLSEIFQLLPNQNQDITLKLKDFNQYLNELSEPLTVKAQSLEMRETMVEIMTTSLEYWEVTTQKTKIQLAEESQIWRAYLDRDRFHTKTLDRYLHLQTLPKNPRWKNVLDTAYFVLTHCPPVPVYQDRLKASTDHFKQILRMIQP